MLKIENLSKSFGGVAATNDVSLHFPKGSLTAVIGPNGAGKTTFFNLITGAFKADKGRILLDGRDIAGLSPPEVVQRGIGTSHCAGASHRTCHSRLGCVGKPAWTPDLRPIERGNVPSEDARRARPAG